MTRDELVAVLKGRKVTETSHNAYCDARDRLQHRMAIVNEVSAVDCCLAAAQAADAERLTKALEAALRAAELYMSDENLLVLRARAAFAASLTGDRKRAQPGGEA